MGKKVDVTLAFNADTGKAKSQIQELQSLLNKISYSGATASQSSANAKNLREAADAAKDLAYHLNNAYNNKTGKFDLSLFDKSLKSSNQNLTGLSTKLMSAGKTGQDAFVKLAQSISKADQPMFKLSTRMQDFAKTMKNTIKWQLSSSMLHGFMGAIQSAYGYAKNLNASLNDIRIVTGQSADQMAAFAEQANKAAKRLSTTTTDYTKSSLIYFQQGLDTEEVRKRTEVTIKMANVAGTTAQTVSDQMTAVWNNFYDGGKSLEYYSDVMVALGAATASSTDEISEGVNKFAAAAKTVGLSYEYATAALATITAKTRESADVVGNALKTIFSRLQGLNLGETLDDGTTLNKYSKALDAVGISIKTTDGQLKDMDTILDEMGTKWQTLGKDQQMALAQTVAGVRQYAQLIALMNNYDYFKENLNVAYGAEGTLKKQVDIYAESWEAAEKRVRASMQGIYQSLIDDKFFIGINNALADALSGLDAFIDAAGGLPTVLTTIGSIFLSVFANKMPEAFKNLKYNFDVFTKGANAAYKNIVEEMKTATKQGYDDYAKSTGTQGIDPNSSSGYALQAASDLTIARSRLAEVNDQLNSSEQQRYNTELGLIDQQQQEIVGLKQKAEALQEIITTLENEFSDPNNFDITDKIFGSVDKIITESLQEVNNYFAEIEADYDDFGRDIQQVGANYVKTLTIALREGKKGTIDLTKDFKILTDQMKNFNFKNLNADNFEDFKNQIMRLFDAIPNGIKNVSGLSTALREVARAGDVSKFTESYQKLIGFLQKDISVDSSNIFKALRGSVDAADLKKLQESYSQLPKVQREVEEGQQRINQALAAFQPTHAVQGIEAIASAASAMTGVVNILNQLKGFSDAFTNPDLTGWERFSEILSSIGFMVPSIISVLKNIGTITKWQSDYAEKISAAKDLELVKEQAIGKAKQEQQVIDTIMAGISDKKRHVSNAVYKNLLASVGLEKTDAMVGELKNALEKEGLKLKQNGQKLTYEQLANEKATVNQVLQRLAAEKGITQEQQLQKQFQPSGIQSFLTNPASLVAIAAITVAVTFLVSWLRQLNLETAKASEVFEAMNDAAEKAESTYKDLQSTIEKYSSGVEKLKDLENGTQDFTDALIEANQEAYKLIENFNLIQGIDWKINPLTGLIEFINKDLLDELTKQQQERTEDVKAGQVATRVGAAQESMSEKIISFNDLLVSSFGQKIQARIYGYGYQITDQLLKNLKDQDFRKILYQILGYSDGSFSYKRNSMSEEQYINYIITQLAEAGYSNFLNSSGNISASTKGILSKIYNGTASFYDLYSIDSQIQKSKNGYNQLIQENLSNEKPYQETLFKNEILESLSSWQNIFQTAVLQEFKSKDSTDIDYEYNDFLRQSGYYVKDNKVYATEEDADNKTNEITNLSNLTTEQKKDILIMIETMKRLEARGISMAENYNEIVSKMTVTGQETLDQLSQGLSGFSTEQIKKYKDSGQILLEDLFEPDDIEKLTKNGPMYQDVLDWLENINKELSEWQLPDFSLEDWASKYKSIQDTVDNKLKEGYGAVLESADYEKLGEEYSQYFAIQKDGTAVLIADVKELNEAIRNNKLKELNDDLEKSQSTIPQALKNAGFSQESLDNFDVNKYYEDMFGEANRDYLIELVNNGKGTSFRELAKILGIEQGELSAEDWIQGVQDAYKELIQKISDEQFNKLQMASTVEEFKQWAEEADTLEDDDKLTAWKVAFANIVSEASLAMDSVSKYSKLLQTTMGMSVQEADEASMRYFQLLQGQKTFQSNWDDWDEKKSQGTLSKELYNLQDALQDLVGSSTELADVDFGFFLKNWELIEKATDGDIDAVNELIRLLNQLGYSIPNIEAVANGLVKVQSTFKDRKKIYSGLSAGDIISKDDYNNLLDEQRKLFTYAGDDTYFLNAKTDEAQAKFRTAEINKAVKDNQRAQRIANSDTLSDFSSRMNYAAFWNNQEYWNQNQIRETLKSQVFQDAANALDLVQEKGESAAEYIRRVAQALYSLPDGSQNIGFMATSIKELSEMLSSAKISVEEYNEAFDSVFKANIDEEGFDYEEVLKYAEALQSSESAMVETEQEAKKLALVNSKLNRGISSLSSNAEKWSKILVKGADTINGDYISAMFEAREAIADILDVDISTVSEKFVLAANASDLLTEAADGSKESLEKLQGEYRVSLITNFDEDIQNQINPLLETLQTQLDNTDLKVGMSLDEAGLSQVTDAFNALLEAGALTVQDLEGIFNSFQFSPEVEWEAVPIANANVQKAQYYYKDSMGNYVAWDGSSETASDGYVYVPKINSSKSIYKPTGGASIPKTSSGGGGGGSSKHAEKKNDSDKERYHTVLNQLEDLNAEYDDISKAKDRAFGKDRLAYMDAEIKKTDELIAKQGEYLDQIKNYLPIDKAVLEATYKDLIGGPEMLFDEKGNISNFDAIQDAMYAKYNEMTEKFTEDDEQWEIFQKQYEQLEKYLDKYEETYDLLRDEEQKYQDLINQRIDAQLEKVQYKVEVKLDVSKDEVAVLEYQLGRIDDDAFKSIDAIDLLIDKSVQLKKQIEINKQGLNDALALSLSAAEISEVMAGNMSVLEGKNFTDEQVQAIKDYRDNLLSLNEELDDIRENIESKVLKAFDAWNEKLSTGVDIIDSYSSALDHFKNIVDIVGQDVLGLDENFMQGLSQTAVDNSINKVKATKAAMESTMAAQERAQRSLEKARAQGDEKSQKMWEDTLKQLDEEARSAQDTFLQAWEDALNSLADQFEQTVNRVVQNFNKTIYNLGGLEGLANDFSRQKEDSDMMLDDYQKIYELSKLSRDINKTIDDTDIISGKQKLKKLLGQVNDLQADGVKMSKYDLEYLQKTYDLRLAELELEEAQRAKNTVRLQKDNEGNWAYIYTQSTDAIDSAQQKYEDALYAMQDLSSNYIDEMSEKLINTSQEMADALAALRVQDFASLDDYYREVERVQKQYQDRMALQEDELNKAIANNKELYDTDWMNYHNATGYKISDTENFATSFKDTLLGALMQSDTDSSNFTELLGQSVQQLTNGLMQAAETYYTNLENAMNAAGTSTNTFGEDISKVIEDIKAKSAEGAQAVEDMANQMNNAINDTMATVENWQKAYSEAMEKIIQSNLDVINSFNELIKTLGADASNVSINYNVNRGPSSAQRFATGGYTGEWGSSGKLAILDEKELILNQNDTANMLSAIQLTREIMNAIDIGANYASLGFGNLVATSLRDSRNEALEQNVHITAEFPNVNNHNEIEEALRNLINTASQYANRT